MRVWSILVPLVGMCIAVAQPLARYASKQRDEAAAVRALRQIHEAQERFKAAVGSFATDAATLVTSCPGVDAVSLRPSSRHSGVQDISCSFVPPEARRSQVTTAMDARPRPTTISPRPLRRRGKLPIRRLPAALTASCSSSSTAFHLVSQTWPVVCRSRSMRWKPSRFRKDEWRRLQSPL